jgi:hypothetical protein
MDYLLVILASTVFIFTPWQIGLDGDFVTPTNLDALHLTALLTRQISSNTTQKFIDQSASLRTLTITNNRRLLEQHQHKVDQLHDKIIPYPEKFLDGMLLSFLQPDHFHNI